MASNHKYSTNSPTGLSRDEPEPIEAANFPEWFRLDFPRAAEWTVDEDHPERPRLSHHVTGGGGERGRWLERTPWWSVAPETAFDEAIQITRLDLEVFADADGRVPDRVYAFDEQHDNGSRYGVLFLVCDDGPEKHGVCVTTYRISNSELPPWVKSYLWDLLTHHDGEGDRR